MYANHFRIKLLDTVDGWDAKIICRYCKDNIFAGTMKFPSRDDLWDRMAELYKSDFGARFDFHLMYCDKYQETLDK